MKARDYVLVYPDQATIDDITIDREEFDQINLGHGGVIVTAPGDEVDFVSRFFTPQATILEDPVTGSAHCSLVPYWHDKTGKTEFEAEQRSARRGQLHCTLSGDRVLVLIGAGHVPILHHAAQSAPDVELVTVSDVLTRD